jgi:ankyrin repeat protein
VQRVSHPVALLLERGADHALIDDRGKTALQMADDSGHLEVKKILEQRTK